MSTDARCTGHTDPEPAAASAGPEPRGAAPPAGSLGFHLAALLDEIGRTAAEAAALSQAIEAELRAETAIGPQADEPPWAHLEPALEDRILPITLKERFTSPADRQRAITVRRAIRLLREGEQLRAEAERLRAQISDLATRSASALHHSQALLQQSAALLSHCQQLRALSEQTLAVNRRRQRHRAPSQRPPEEAFPLEQETPAGSGRGLRRLPASAPCRL